MNLKSTKIQLLPKYNFTLKGTVILENAVLFCIVLRAGAMAESLPGPSMEKKRKTSGSTIFRFSWTLPENITSSAKSNKFVYCKLCLNHFSITHGGINDIKHHCEGKGHSERLKESQQSSMTKFMDTATSSQTNKVIAADDSIYCNA